MKYKTFEEFKEAALEVAPWCENKVEWTTGGRTGGSCWDEGEPTYYGVSTEEEPDDEDLDNILQVVIPDLTYLEYRKLNRADIYERGERTQNEYYGNYYEYSWRQLNLKNLYKALVDISGAR
jgi:hypothetical protein